MKQAANFIVFFWFHVGIAVQDNIGQTNNDMFECLITELVNNSGRRAGGEHFSKEGLRSDVLFVWPRYSAKQDSDAIEVVYVFKLAKNASIKQGMF